MGLTPEQEAKCMLLDIRIHQSYAMGTFTIWHCTKHDFLVDTRLKGNLAQRQLRYYTADEAIEDYIKNKEHYTWV